jgi:hypothetical protein
MTRIIADEKSDGRGPAKLLDISESTVQPKTNQKKPHPGVVHGQFMG